MKKTVALILVTMMLIGLLAGCGSAATTAAATTAATTKSTATTAASTTAAATGKPIPISVCVETFDNTFASFVMAAMKEYATAHPEIKVTYLDAKKDAATQLTQVENEINAGAKAIICLIVDAKQSTPIVNACKNANVPLIAFNRPFTGASTFIGADGAIAGQMLADHAAKIYNNKANVAIMNGIMGQENQYIRRNAIVETFKAKYPDMKVVLEGAADWKRDLALNLTENWLGSGTKFDCVLTLNDDMGVGTYLALEQAGKKDSIKIFSVNGDPDGLKAVKDGKFVCTLFQDPSGQGKKALEVATEYAKGSKPAEKILVPFKLVTKENVDQFLK